jgi:hypothetical protein
LGRRYDLDGNTQKHPRMPSSMRGMHRKAPKPIMKRTMSQTEVNMLFYPFAAMSQFRTQLNDNTQLNIFCCGQHAQMWLVAVTLDLNHTFKRRY